MKEKEEQKEYKEEKGEDEYKNNSEDS